MKLKESIRYSVYGASRIGVRTYIGEGSIIGHPGKLDRPAMASGRLDSLLGARIGRDCIIRSQSIIYSGAMLGNRVQTGHRILVREDTTIGSETLIGTDTVIEDQCRIGKRVSLQTGVYVPTHCVIDDFVFLGPRAVLTNDPKMARGKIVLEGVHIEPGARIGANCTILPGITIGRDAVIGAGAVVTRDIPAYAVAMGVPARVVRSVPQEERLP